MLVDAPLSFPWQAFGASVQGANHMQRGQINQDALALHEVGDGRGASALFVAVADGHGSSRSFRSDRGARLAVNLAVKELASWLRDLPTGLSFSQLRRQARASWPGRFIPAWRAAVRADLLREPLTYADFALTNEPVPVIHRDDELTPAAALTYGSTLLCAAITPDFILLCQLGDGDIVTVSGDGIARRPMAGDPRILGSATSSLCGINPYPAFRFRILSAQDHPPALILLSTDGYANCFKSQEDFNKVALDLARYVQESGTTLVQENLGAWLTESSQTGSGDDITAILIAPRST